MLYVCLEVLSKLYDYNVALSVNMSGIYFPRRWCLIYQWNAHCWTVLINGSIILTISYFVAASTVAQRTAVGVSQHNYMQSITPQSTLLRIVPYPHNYSCNKLISPFKTSSDLIRMDLYYVLHVISLDFDFVLSLLCISGSLVEARDWSIFRPGAIPELFWGAVEFVSLL